MVEKIFTTSNVLLHICDFRVHMQNKYLRLQIYYDFSVRIQNLQLQVLETFATIIPSYFPTRCIRSRSISWKAAETLHFTLKMEFENVCAEWKCKLSCICNFFSCGIIGLLRTSIWICVFSSISSRLEPRLIFHNFLCNCWAAGDRGPCLVCNWPSQDKSYWSQTLNYHLNNE